MKWMALLALHQSITPDFQSQQRCAPPNSPHRGQNRARDSSSTQRLQEQSPMKQRIPLSLSNQRRICQKKPRGWLDEEPRLSDQQRPKAPSMRLQSHPPRRRLNDRSNDSDHSDFISNPFTRERHTASQQKESPRHAAHPQLCLTSAP